MQTWTCSQPMTWRWLIAPVAARKEMPNAVDAAELLGFDVQQRDAASWRARAIGILAVRACGCEGDSARAGAVGGAMLEPSGSG